MPEQNPQAPADFIGRAATATGGVLDRIFGYVVLPLLPYILEQTGFGKSVSEGTDKALRVGRKALMQIQRAFIHQAVTPTIWTLVVSAALSFTLTLCTATYVAIPFGWVLLSLFMGVLSFAFAIWQTQAIPSYLRDSEGQLRRYPDRYADTAFPAGDARNGQPHPRAGEIMLNPKMPYNPQAFSIGLSSVLIICSWSILAIMQMIFGSLGESSWIITLGIASFIVPYLIMHILAVIIAWSVKMTLDATEAGIGFAKEQVLVLFPGHTFGNTPRGSAELVNQEMISKRIRTLPNTLLLIYIQQAIFQLAFPNFTLLQVTVLGQIMLLSAAVVLASRMKNGRSGLLVVEEALYDWAFFQFKYLTPIGLGLLLLRFLLPEAVIVFLGGVWSAWGPAAPYCLEARENWLTSLALITLGGFLLWGLVYLIRYGAERLSLAGVGNKILGGSMLAFFLPIFLVILFYSTHSVASVFLNVAGTPKICLHESTKANDGKPSFSTLGIGTSWSLWGKRRSPSNVTFTSPATQPVKATSITKSGRSTETSHVSTTQQASVVRGPVRNDLCTPELIRQYASSHGGRLPECTFAIVP